MILPIFHMTSPFSNRHRQAGHHGRQHEADIGHQRPGGAQAALHFLLQDAGGQGVGLETHQGIPGIFFVPYLGYL